MHEVKIRQICYGSEEHRAAFDLRNQVLRIPRGLDLYRENPHYEADALHLGAFMGSSLIGTVCFWIENDYILVKHVAVDSNLRGSGIGKKLMSWVEQYARENEMCRILLKARVSAEGFYHSLGFHAVGEVIADSIPHIMMEKLLRSLFSHYRTIQSNF